MLISLVISFLVSLIISIVIVKLSNKVKKLITDHIHSGIQKFHKTPTPRIGGVAIFIGVFITLAIRDFTNYIPLILASFLAFFSGLFEDLTRKLNPKMRIILTSLGAIIAFLLAGVSIVRVDVLYVDEIFRIGIISLIFTVIAIVGLTNAINIIDGFNGLASMVSISILLAISYVAFKVGDSFVLVYSLVLIGAILGFFILNYPYGLIFLGDGGAYFIGFSIAVMSILLVKKHPEVSAWFAVLVNIYPVYETLFSIYRKKFLRKRSPTSPDGLHLHMLFYKIIVKKLLGIKNPIYRNPATSPLIWVINMIGVISAILFWNNTILCILFILVFIIFYTVVYWQVIYQKLLSR